MSALRIHHPEPVFAAPARPLWNGAGGSLSLTNERVLLTTETRTLAQFSERDDLLFRGLMVPVGLLLVAIGVRGMRRQRMHLSRHRDPVEGKTAVFIGAGVIVIGVLCSAAALYSFVS